MTTPVREGEILAGKYRVDRVLGVGGMGVVVAAHHLQLDEKVALKFLLPSALENQEAVARFAREARAAVKIKSEHVARVSDVGTLENGAPYIVMEYLEGSDLSAWIRDRGALSVAQAVEFVLQACEAIAEAHAVGIVHRDLKPANIFVIRRADGVLSVKVLDFGISKMDTLAVANHARQTDDTEGGHQIPSGRRGDTEAYVAASGGPFSLTETSALMGSPLYMSPEQMESSKNVDARGDIWALGVILYELVTGGPPFSGGSMPELILRIISAPPAPMRTAQPGAYDGLERVIFRCLEKDRGKRFQTIGELAVALLPFAPERSKSSVERISGVLRAAGRSTNSVGLPPSSNDRDREPTAAGTAASWGKTIAGKGNGAWIALAVVGTIAALLVALVMMRKPTSGEEARPAIAAPSAIVVQPIAVSTPPTVVARSAADAPRASISEKSPAAAVPVPPLGDVADLAKPTGSAKRTPPPGKARGPRLPSPAPMTTSASAPRPVQPAAPIATETGIYEDRK